MMAMRGNTLTRALIVETIITRKNNKKRTYKEERKRNNQKTTTLLETRNGIRTYKIGTLKT